MARRLGKIGDIQETLKDYNIKIKDIKMNDVFIRSLSKAARGHWGVENQLHWHLDFIFRDGHNTTAEKTCAKNMQMLKKIALAILRIVQTMYSQSLKRIRKTIARDCKKELENILSALSADAIKAALYKTSNEKTGS